MISPDFEVVASLQERDEWGTLDGLMVEWTANMKICGAVCVVIGANTMHRSVPAIVASSSPTVIHIADAVVARCKKEQINKVALTGTLFTMENTLYISRLQESGIAVFVPPERDRIHKIIYEELTKQQVREESRTEFVRIVNAMVDRDGVEAVILGCTELPLLFGANSELPRCKLINTTECHCEAAMEFLVQYLAK